MIRKRKMGQRKVRRLVQRNNLELPIKDKKKILDVRPLPPRAFLRFDRWERELLEKRFPPETRPRYGYMGVATDIKRVYFEQVRKELGVS